MRSIPVTIQIPVRDIAQAMAAELGLQPVKLPKIARSETSWPGNGGAVTRHEVPTVEQAVADVVQATNRLDRDQYTSGAAASTTRLFEACKRLRRAQLEASKSPAKEQKS